MDIDPKPPFPPGSDFVPTVPLCPACTAQAHRVRTEEVGWGWLVEIRYGCGAEIHWKLGDYTTHRWWAEKACPQTFEHDYLGH